METMNFAHIHNMLISWIFKKNNNQNFCLEWNFIWTYDLNNNVKENNWYARGPRNMLLRIHMRWINYWTYRRKTNTNGYFNDKKISQMTTRLKHGDELYSLKIEGMIEGTRLSWKSIERCTSAKHLGRESHFL